MAQKTIQKKQSSILDSFFKKNVSIEVEQTNTVDMVTDVVIQQNEEITDSEMHDHEVCESINDENSFFDVDISDVLDEKNDTDIYMNSDFEEHVDNILDENSSFMPEWSSKVEPLKKNVLESQIIVGQDASGSKMFAIFNSHQEILDYSDNLPKEHRVFYEYIQSSQPARLVFDIDSYDPSIIGDIRNQMILVQNVLMCTLDIFQSMNIDCQFLNFKISDSSRKNKFSLHLVSNYYFETWEMHCKFKKI